MGHFGRGVEEGGTGLIVPQMLDRVRGRKGVLQKQILSEILDEISQEMILQIHRTCLIVTQMLVRVWWGRKSVTVKMDSLVFLL